MLINLVSGVRDLCVEKFGLRCQGPVLMYLVSGVRDLCVDIFGLRG